MCFECFVLCCVVCVFVLVCAGAVVFECVYVFLRTCVLLFVLAALVCQLAIGVRCCFFGVRFIVLLTRLFNFRLRRARPAGAGGHRRATDAVDR